MSQSSSPHNAGVTLIEVLVSVAIIGLIVAAVGALQGNIFTFNRYFESSFTTAEKAQKLLRPMTAEIRSASPSSNGSYPIETATSYEFSFYSDIDNDGLKDRVRYYVSGTDLMKDVTEPAGSPPAYNAANKVTTTFMSGVRNQIEGIPIFTYYDSTYTGGESGTVPSGQDVELIRMVGISIRLDGNPNQPPGPVDIISQVSIRNLKQQ